ncbi:YIP1 family protein [Natronospora cellulosivora (SeqCode)]
MGRVKRMVNIFLSPTEVFEELKEKSDWLIPLLLILIVSLLLSYFILDVTIPTMIEEVHANPDLSAMEREQQIAYLESPIMYVSSVIGGFLGNIIIYLILAGVFVLISFVFGGEKIAFKNIFSGAVYVGLIGILASIFAGLITYSTGELSTGLTLGLFLPASGYLERLIGGISIFGIWQVILYSLMLMVFYNYSKKKAFSIMFALYGGMVFILSLFYFIPGF